MFRRFGNILTVAFVACLAATLGFAAPAQRPAPDPQGSAVDVELVLAVDVSYSMDPEEQALQREGYIKAITSTEFLRALRQGMNGRVALTYFEWASSGDQKVIIPWRVIEGPETADSVANEIAAAPYRRAARTSISGALVYSLSLFEMSGYRGIRRVIDVSGDGTNNNGPLIVPTREQVLAKGITINGLPIMLKRPNPSTLDIENLDVYYEDCVIGGPGSFVIPIRDRDQFIEATRTKLVLEVAGLAPPARVIPASADKPRISCTIGEKMWMERWGSGGMDGR